MGTVTCSKCKKHYSDHLTYCPHCAEYLIGGISFKHKTQIIKYAKTLKEVPETVYDPTHAAYHFLLDLIQQGHLEPKKKIGVGVKEFYIAESWKGVTRFMVRRTDSSEIDFSYLKCIEHLNRPRVEVLASRNWTKLLSACRDAIYDQLAKYRNLHRPWKCAKCGTDNPDALYEVDHLHTNFVDIVLAFNEGRTDTPAEFDDCPLDYLDVGRAPHKFREEDSAYAIAFQEFHKNQATLQILCKPCNMAKSREAGIKHGTLRKVGGQ